MSEAKRYSMMWGEDEGGCIYVSPFEHLHGDWVRHGDYARLKAEVERLRKACELVFDESAKRKFLMCYRGNDFYVSLEAMEAMSVALGYRAAKEGKPSV